LGDALLLESILPRWLLSPPVSPRVFVGSVVLFCHNIRFLPLSPRPLFSSAELSCVIFTGCNSFEKAHQKFCFRSMRATRLVSLAVSSRSSPFFLPRLCRKSGTLGAFPPQTPYSFPRESHLLWIEHDSPSPENPCV